MTMEKIYKGQNTGANKNVESFSHVIFSFGELIYFNLEMCHFYNIMARRTSIKGTAWRHDTQYNDIRYNDTQYVWFLCYTQH